MMILKKTLNYGGRLWEAGENVTGQLPIDLILELQESGAIHKDESPAQETADGGPAISAADFADLGADEQKNALNCLG